MFIVILAFKSLIVLLKAWLGQLINNKDKQFIYIKLMLLFSVIMMIIHIYLIYNNFIMFIFSNVISIFKQPILYKEKLYKGFICRIYKYILQVIK